MCASCVTRNDLRSSSPQRAVATCCARGVVDAARPCFICRFAGRIGSPVRTPRQNVLTVWPGLRGADVMCNLRTLWDISDESFRSLLEIQLARRHTALPGHDVSPNELISDMPGDELIAAPNRVHMRAETINAPIPSVWPWLAQMMRGAGIYGWPRLESSRCASATCILSSTPPPRIGDRVGQLLELAEVDPPRAVVWQSCQPIIVLGLLICALTMSFQLHPIDDNRCRLVVRQRCRLNQQSVHLARRLSNLIHFLLPCSQIQRIKYHVEARIASGAAAPCRLNSQQHQAAPFIPAQQP